jgi:hypothetical protein
MNGRLTSGEFVKLARELPANERTPYAFEKRIMARLADSPVADAVSEWAHLLWRAMAPCLGIMLLVAAVSLAMASNNPASDEGPDLEAAVFAPTQVAFDASR